MTAAVAETPITAALRDRLALIACGENSYPGKTQACDTHRTKAATLLRITATGSVDNLAAAICGTGDRRVKTCDPCRKKAVRMISIYNGETV